MAKKTVIQKFEHKIAPKEYTYFQIQTDEGKEFGQLEVGKSGIKWWPKGSKTNGTHINWAKLDSMMKDA